MNLTVRRNGGIPSLLSDFFSPASVLGRDLFDLDNDLLPGRIGINVPSANITESTKSYNIELAVPGLERKDFKVEVDNHTLTISAEREERKEETDAEYSRKEYSYNSFSRIFTLPENVKEDNIDAKYENGILKISIPKSKETPMKGVQKVTVS